MITVAYYLTHMKANQIISISKSKICNFFKLDLTFRPLNINYQQKEALYIPILQLRI